MHSGGDDAFQEERLTVAAHCHVVRKQGVQRAGCLGHQAVGGIEAGERQAGFGFAAARGVGDVEQQGVGALARIAGAQLRPGIGIEQRSGFLLLGVLLGLPVGLADIDGDVKPAAAADANLLGSGADGDIVRMRLDGQPLGGLEQAEFDELIGLWREPCRAGRGGDGNGQAGRPGFEPVDTGQARERHGEDGLATLIHAALRFDRGGGSARILAEVERPDRSIVEDPGERLTGEPEPDDRDLALAGHRAVLDQHGYQPGEPGGVDGVAGVEDQRHDAGIEEGCGARRAREAEVETFAFDRDGDRPGGRFGGSRGCRHGLGGEASRFGCRREGQGLGRGLRCCRGGDRGGSRLAQCGERE